MTNLDREVTLDPRLMALARAGTPARGYEAAGSGLDRTDRLALLGQALSASRDGELSAQILAGAGSALTKVGDGAAHYTLREALGLEAVVQLVDRPSLTVQDGFVNQAATASALFAFKLTKLQDQIRDVIAAIGRINVPPGKQLVGTAIHVGESRVATNRHVLEQIAAQNAAGGWTLRWPDATTIDFVGEAGLAVDPCFKVVGVGFHGPDPINQQIDFAHLDLAILEIEPLAGKALPKSVTLGGDPAELTVGQWVYAVGFPGRPKIWNHASTPWPGYEVASVIESSFDDVLDCKKFAPGQVLRAPGTLMGDETKSWVFAHDCSTLRGNSGSAIVEFAASGARVLGIHFGGIARSANWGHAFAALREAMTGVCALYAESTVRR